jgi:hypothetical protein
MKEEDERREQLWNDMYSVKIMNVRGEHYAHLQNKMVKAEEKHRAELWNEMCSVRMMMLKAEEIRHAHSQSERDSTKKMTNGSSWMLMEQMLGNPASMVSPVKTGTPRKNYILASKTTSEKEEKSPLSKVQVAFMPPPNLKAVRPNVGSGSNTMNKPGKGHVQTLDFSKTKTKINTWRKT